MLYEAILLFATYPIAVLGVFQPINDINDVTLMPLSEAFVPQDLLQQ
jgi:hypothetical protein